MATLKRSSEDAELQLDQNPMEVKKPRLDLDVKDDKEEDKVQKPEWVLFQVRGEDEDQLGYYTFDRTSTPHAAAIIDTIRDWLGNDRVDDCAHLLDLFACKYCDRTPSKILKVAAQWENRGKWMQMTDDEVLQGVECVLFFAFQMDQ